MRNRTTAQVAKELGVGKARILMAVNRHPELKPAQSFGQNFAWNDSEVQRLVSHFGSHKAGRPSKAQ